MKYLLFIILLVGVVLAAGCMNGNQSKPTHSIDSIPQIKSAAQTISYDDIFRYNEKHIDEIVYFRGKIDQITPTSGGSADEYNFRVATKKSEYSGYSDDIIWVNYKGSRYLEGDIIDLWARVTGLRTYSAVLGNRVTIPELDALNVELVSKASGTSSEASKTPTSTPTLIPTERGCYAIIADDPQFTVLGTMIRAAKLDTAFDTGSFTILAPTNTAFAQLPGGTISSLLKDPEGQLKQVLLNHVIDGKTLMAVDIVKLGEAKTMQGTVLKINTKDGVTIGSAKVTKTDIVCKNGVIHVIDRVLVPPNQ